MSDVLVLLHPKMVHFPIALFIAALGFEFIGCLARQESLRQTAWYLYIAAALMTPLVVRTGIWEQTRLHLSHPVLNQHRMFALWTMWVSLLSLPLLWFVKQKFSKYFHILFIVCLIGISTLVTLTGHNGGRMVYEYGAGVDQ